MIYVVSTSKDIPKSNEYQFISVEESLEILRPIKILGVDTETSGLDCHNDTLLSLQMGNYDDQIVVDCLTIDIQNYKEILEDPNRELLLWNSKFDLQWLYRYKIYPYKVYDGFLAEKLLWLGYPLVLTPTTYNKIRCDRYTYIPPDESRKTKEYYMLEMNLKKACKMYCNVELDKEERKTIISKGITSKGTVIYSALDVKYLEQIKQAQEVSLREKGLLTAIKYENNFILSLAYMAFCGVKIDVQKWKQKMLHDQEALDNYQTQLDKWLIENDPDNPNIFIDYQGDLFAGFNLEPQVKLNWSSPKQVIDVFKKFGVDVSGFDKSTKEEKESVGADVLKGQADKCSLIPIYIKYKEAAKVVGTYGQNFLDSIDTNTGRLYTNWNPIGTDTCRISSGGKDKSTGKKYINMLNLPSDKETRSCFVAEEGNCWISLDYSGQETFVMADISGDKALLKELNEGSADIHSLTAYLSYKEIPRDTPISEIKTKYHDLRQAAKGIEFAINYGGDANTISKNSGIPYEEAQAIYNNYMNGFKGLKKYQDKCRKEWWNLGYIDLNPKVGYKAFIYDYNYLKSIDKDMQDPEYRSHYFSMKNTDPNSHTVLRVKELNSRKHATEKQNINYKIQHTGALCYKVSMIKFFKYIREHNLLGKVLITVTPYDEINCEAPKEIALEVTKALYQCMVDAGAYFCTKCKLDADISWAKDEEGHSIEGQLPTYWIH